MSRLLRRGPLVLTALGLGLLVLLGTGRTWLRVDLTGLLTGAPFADVAGTTAAPVVGAVALVALAAAAALSVAGRVTRVMAAVVVTLAGVVVVVGSLALRADPVPAASAALAERTAGVAVDASRVSVTTWPAVTAAGGTLLTATGAAALLAGRRWTTARRYESSSTAGPATPASDWDALSRGDDPTERDDEGPA